MPPLEWWRDLLLTIWAALAIVQSCLLAFLLGAMIYVVLKLKGRASAIFDAVQNVLGTVQDTAGTARDTATSVRGTAVFLSDHAAQPVIAVASLIAGTRRAVTAFMRLLRKEHPPDEA